MRTAVFVLGAMCFVGTPALAATPDCNAAWTRADANKDGVLSTDEGSTYFSAAKVTEGTMKRETFDAHCAKGDFKSAMTTDTDEAAPVPGANSFTESQAKERVTQAGLTDVGALAKDDAGVWRGKAKRGGADVDVAVDFKGNVVVK